MSTMQISIDSEYMAAAARVRNVSVSKLVNMLLETICRDQMVNMILDDNDGADTRKKVAKGTIKTRAPRKVTNVVRSNLRPTPAAAVPYRSTKIQPSREELRRETQQAILNTGGVIADGDPPSSACPPSASPLSSQTVPSPEVDIDSAKESVARNLRRCYGYSEERARELAGLPPVGESRGSYPEMTNGGSV